MIKAKLLLPDKREIPVLIRNRTYKKLTLQINNLSFWKKIKLLFCKEIK